MGVPRTRSFCRLLACEMLTQELLKAMKKQHGAKIIVGDNRGGFGAGQVEVDLFYDDPCA